MNLAHDPFGPADHIEVEVLVIGSGAGGAPTAALLAEAGFEVLIVEEGSWVEQGEVKPFSLDQMARQYRSGGVTVALGSRVTTTDASIDCAFTTFTGTFATQPTSFSLTLPTGDGDKTAVDAVLTHPLVHAVSFVGSTAVARHIYSRASLSGKRVQAQGGMGRCMDEPSTTTAERPPGLRAPGRPVPG